MDISDKYKEATIVEVFQSVKEYYQIEAKVRVITNVYPKEDISFLRIYKIEDDYYGVVYGDIYGDGGKCFIADQFDGLIELLTNINKDECQI